MLFQMGWGSSWFEHEPKATRVNTDSEGGLLCASAVASKAKQTARVVINFFALKSCLLYLNPAIQRLAYYI